MKYALIFRKLIINNIAYYQAISKVTGELIENNNLYVTSGEYKNQEISAINNSNASLVYFEISKDAYQKIETINLFFLKKMKNKIYPIHDSNEEKDIILAFYKKFHDFSLLPNYDINSLIQSAKFVLNKKVLGQEKSISKILAKIYNNQMLLQSDLDYNTILRHKSNILVLGPYGTGKSTIADILIEMLTPIPVISYSLTGNYKEDISEIIKKLYMASDGNLFLAERGIVIFDNINLENFVYYEDDMKPINNKIEDLKHIVNLKNIHIQNLDDKFLGFDYSKITNICLVDNDYEYVSLENDLFYTKVGIDTLSYLGLTTDFIKDKFDGEIIFMEEMTYDLALKILKNKNISPLYQFIRVLALQGKKVHISKTFISNLINIGLDLGDGFKGIIGILKIVFQSKDLSRNVIYLRESDLDKVSIGTVLPDDNIEVVNDSNLSKKDNKTLKWDLKVDVLKGTINNLRVLDVVDMIKENIKGQDEQIFFFVNAFYEHVLARYKGFTNHELSELKSNVMLIGPTGVGKTAIVSNLARIFNLPFSRAIAPRYSKSGYVGASVDSILMDLVDAAGGNIEKAEQGILYIDEVDKISAANDLKNLDMNLGVQQELLTLIEGDKRVIKDETYLGKSITFDSSNLFVIATGAFDGLDKIIETRIKKEHGLDKIGFMETKQTPPNLKVTSEDLYQYGFDRQFIARFPNKIRLNSLNTDIFYQIINDSKDGFIKLALKSYQKSGIIVSLSEGFKRGLAEKSFAKKEGVRAIKSVFGEIKSAIDYTIQTENIAEVILDEKSLEGVENIQYIKKRK